jgi:hypothetical protein
MSDTPASEAKAPAAGDVAPPGGAKAAATGVGTAPAAAEAPAPAKPPARPVSEIRADIEKERAELSRSFETLRADLDEAATAGKQRASDTGKKAKIAGPAVAGVVATLVVARMLFKRRARKER